jgi:tetratricopeptide (TPR) repeat protein
MLRKSADTMKQEGYWRFEHRIYRMIGQVYYAKNELQHSRRYFELYLRTVDKNRRRYSPLHESIFNFYIALLDLKRGRISEAEKGLKKIQSHLTTTNDPFEIDHINYHRNLLAAELSYISGSFANSTKEYESAMQHFKTGSTMLIENAVDYNMRPGRDFLARIYCLQNKTGKAIKQYEHLVKFDPATTERRLIHPTYHYQLALLYVQERSYTVATKHLNKFLELWCDANEDNPELALARQKITEIEPLQCG